MAAAVGKPEEQAFKDALLQATRRFIAYIASRSNEVVTQQEVDVISVISISSEEESVVELSKEEEKSRKEDKEAARKEDKQARQRGEKVSRIVAAFEVARSSSST